MARSFTSGQSLTTANLDLNSYNKASVSFWLYWDAFAGDDKNALEFGSIGDPGTFEFRPNYSTGTFRIALRGDVALNQATFTRPSAAAWHHYVVCLDYSLATNEISAVYVDGVSQTLTHTHNGNNTSGFRATSALVFNPNSGNCRFAETAIYGGVILGTDDVNALAKGATPTMVRPDVLDYYWPLIGKHSPENELIQAKGATLTGTPTASDHPRIYKPNMLQVSGAGAARTFTVASTGGLKAGDKRFVYPPTNLGNLADPSSRNEISGIVQSRKTTGLLWGVEDSGATRTLYAIGTDGSNKGNFLCGTTTAVCDNVDWEDISTAEIGGIHYLYIADTGDNTAVRANVQVYRIKEPTVTAPYVGGNVADIDIEKITITWPSGARDIETIMVDPLTGDMYFIQKRNSTANLYKLAHSASYVGTQTPTLEGVMSIPLDHLGFAATGGDIEPNGLEALVKTNDQVFHFIRPNTSTTISQMLLGSFREAPYIGFGTAPDGEPNGEGICFNLSDLGYYTVSEDEAGTGIIPLWRYPRYINPQLVFPVANSGGLLIGGSGLVTTTGGIEHAGTMFHNGYFYRKLITIPRKTATADLTNFVVPVVTTLTTSKVFNRVDFRFEDTSETFLQWELESYDHTTGEFVAWVRIPLLKEHSETHFWLYYGNPLVTTLAEGTPWTAYHNVYHLAESGTGAVDEYEEAANNNDGQGGLGLTNTVPTRVAGKIGKGQSFDTTDYIHADPDAVANGSAMSVSGWVYLEALTIDRFIFSRGRDDGTGDGCSFQVGIRTNGKLFGMVQTVEDDWTFHEVSGTTVLNTGTWYHVAVTHDPATAGGAGDFDPDDFNPDDFDTGDIGGGLLKIYLNGVLEATTTHAGQSLVPSTFGNEIGRRNKEANWHGKLDEIRLAPSALSAAWIATDYTITNNPALMTFGEEGRCIHLSGFPTIQANYNADNPTGGITLSGTTTHTMEAIYTGAGGAALSGTATSAIEFAREGAGGIAIGGAIDPPIWHIVLSGEGGASLTGEAPLTVSYSPPISGGISLDGSVIPTVVHAGVTGSGGIILGGTADNTATLSANYAASGAITLGGTATMAHELNIVGSGGISLSGSIEPTATFTFVVASPSGTLGLFGLSEPQQIYNVTGAGGATLTGEAPTGASYNVAATGGASLSGTVPGVPSYNVTVCGD